MLYAGWRPANYGKSKEQPDDEDWLNGIGKGDGHEDTDETDLIMFNTIYVQREYGKCKRLTGRTSKLFVVIINTTTSYFISDINLLNDQSNVPMF